MSQPFAIPANERGELDEIGPGMPREVFRSSELLRRWTVVWDQHGEMWLRHAQGAMLYLRWSGDEIASLRTFEGDAAREQDLRWSWRFEPALLQRLQAALVAGAPLEAALEQAAGRRHVRVTNLRVDLTPDGGQARVYRAGGVLEVGVGPDGAVRSTAWLEGAEAADRAASAAVPSADELLPGVRAASTWGEALLATRAAGGKPIAARIENAWDPARYVVLAETAHGPRAATFTITDPARPDPRALGDVQQLDAADLLLVASACERDGDPALAAAAVRAALRAIPAGDDAVPAASLTTHTARRMREMQPQRFTRAHLQSELARLTSTEAGR